MVALRLGDQQSNQPYYEWVSSTKQPQGGPEKLGARGVIYQLVGLGNAPGAKTPASKQWCLFPRDPERIAIGLLHGGDLLAKG